jgi:hypothetical protein
MIPLAAMTATKTDSNPWLASVYAGVITAIFAIIFTLLFSSSLVGWIIAFLLIGIGPVLGYQAATKQLVDVKSLIGGLLGGLLPVINIILWPILVGALTKGQSIGKLLLGSIIGAVLGLVVFFIIASVMGQDPAWLSFGVTLGYAVWGGACGALMVAWGN